MSKAGWGVGPLLLKKKMQKKKKKTGLRPPLVSPYACGPLRIVTRIDSGVLCPTILICLATICAGVTVPSYYPQAIGSAPIFTISVGWPDIGYESNANSSKTLDDELVGMKKS